MPEFVTNDSRERLDMMRAFEKASLQTGFKKGSGIMGHRPPDQDIIDAHSTPGLRRNELTRSAKRAQLIETQKGMTMDEREALLDKLYSSPSPNA